MNKVSKIIIFIGLGLLCLSFILVKFDLNSLITQFSSLSDRTYEKVEYISISDIKEIKIDIHNNNIRFIPSTNDDIKITYYETEYDKFIIDDSGNILAIKKRSEIKFFSFDLNFQDTTMIIEIPEEMMLKYDIQTSNGKINFSDLDILSGKFNSSNGKIILENTTTYSDIELKTSNSNIELSNFLGNNVKLTSSNGKIYMKNIDANVISGSTSNGKIELDDLYAAKVDLKSSNGNIYINNLDVPLIYLKTSNGKIEGTINGHFEDYQKDIRTSNAKIEIGNYEYSKIIDKNIKQKKLTLKTSNGRIDINFND